MKKSNPARGPASSLHLSAGLVALLFCAWPLPSRGEPPPRIQRCERGAQGLMEFPKPKLLPSERDAEWLRTLNDAWQGCGKTTYRINTRRAGHDLRVAVHCLTPHREGPLLLFVHGILTDHSTWRYIAGPLSAQYEVWLVDLPGCGDSDAPAPGSLEPDGYSATAMAERLFQALEQRLAALPTNSPPRRIVLVGHSLGGMVCLRMLSAPELRRRHRSFLAQLDRAVLMSTSDFEVNSIPPPFVPLLALAGWKVSAGAGLGLFDSAVRETVRNGYFVSECATVEQQAMSGHMLGNGAHRRAVQAMLRESVPFDPKTHRPDWPAMMRLAQDCALVDKPVLVIWGEWDEALPCCMGHQLKDKLHRATLVTIPGRGHSLPGEDPVRCAALIREFVQGLPPGTLRPDLAVNVYAGTPVAAGVSMSAVHSELP